MLQNEAFICPVCHMGHLDLKLTTYVRQYGETLISVPNTPAWVCDVCHERQYDPLSIQRIETLVGQGGPPPNRYRPEQSRKRQRRTAEPPASTAAKARPKSK
jgi:YgiT-type zinc finger domain-containing protein